MDSDGNPIAQVVAARYPQPYQYFVVPFGLNLLDETQVTDYWIHNEILRIRLAKDFVQNCPKYGCDVVHGKDQVLSIDAFETIESSNPSLTRVPNDIDIVDKTTDYLRRLHNRVNVDPREEFKPVENDFPYWNKVAADIYCRVDGYVTSAKYILKAWVVNAGDAMANLLLWEESHNKSYL